MIKSILILFLSFLAATFVAAQDAFVFFEGSQKTYQVNGHPDSSYDWAVYTQVKPLVAANASAATITGNGGSQISIIWNLAGDYFLLVTETDASGCTNTKAMRISVLSNIPKVSFTNTTSTACYQANNGFAVPVQFTGSAAEHFPMVVSFQINGVDQPNQSITFDNPTLAISGSLFTAGPNSDTPVTIKITGATDRNNSNLQPETALGQNIHTHTIFRNLIAPTVLSQVTNDVTPTISGTATVGKNESLTVLVNGFKYIPGDGNLALSGTNWILTFPANSGLTEGMSEITATISNASCNLTDNTSNELIIDITSPTPIPTVINLTSNDRTPVVHGTATAGAGEILEVTVNGVTYTAGDGNLVLTGTNWSLQIPVSNELAIGTYPVTATVTDAASNSSTDMTSNELTIDNTAPSIPTVISQVTNDATPVISGMATVGAGEIFTVSVNGVTYSEGDGKLLLTANNWMLQIPDANTLPDGIYPVTAKVTDATGNSTSDNTSDELVIDTVPPAIPTVDSQVTSDTTPFIEGTATTGSGEFLSVTVNEITYNPADGKLILTGNVWTLQIPDGKELADGAYQVTATVTDLAGNSSTDVSTGELIINTKTAFSDRLATNDLNITFKNSPVSGNVLSNDAGFYGINSTIGTIPELMPVNGMLSMGTDGRYTYTPKNDFTGPDNFYYTVCTTEDPADCDTMNVTIRVVSDVLADIMPVASDDEMQTLQNTAVRGNLLSNDLSVSGEKLMLNLKQKEGPKSGTLVLTADGSFVYTPEPGFVGQDGFVYEVCGVVSGFCDHARVTITVSSDPHEVRLFAADDVYFSYGKIIQGNLLANDLYPSASALKVTKTPVIQAANGTVILNSNGTFSYTPVAGFAGTDQFVYEICDPQLPDCDQATVYVAVKETPELYADLSIRKTGPLSAVPGETVNYELTVTNLGTATAGTVQLIDYLPAAIENPKFNISGSTVSKDWEGFYELAELKVDQTFSLFISGTVAVNAPDTLKNVASVKSSTWDPEMANNVSVIKTAVRRGPVARILGAPYLAVGSCNVTGQILDASNSGGEGLSFSWAPTIYLDNASSSSPIFRPGKTTRYQLTVTDSKGQTDTTSVLVSVADAPQAITDRNVFVDAPDATILLNGSKSTGTDLTYLWLTNEGIILNGGTTSTVQVSGLGMYYLNITDAFGCTAKDSVNVGLWVQAVSDTSETKVNESVIINVVRNDIPAKLINPSSISIVTLPLHGIAEVSADSLILYLPEESYVGQDEFVYAICDYFMHCDQAKVLVLINDVPFFIPEAFSPNGDGINDKFQIKGILKYKTAEIEIFNRWGNIVFQSKNYGEGPGKDGFWDGTAKSGLRTGSGPVPSGTYYYVLKLGGSQNINGSIYLDR